MQKKEGSIAAINEDLLFLAAICSHYGASYKAGSIEAFQIENTVKQLRAIQKHPLPDEVRNTLDEVIFDLSRTIFWTQRLHDFLELFFEIYKSTGRIYAGTCVIRKAKPGRPEREDNCFPWHRFRECIVKEAPLNKPLVHW